MGNTSGYPDTSSFPGPSDGPSRNYSPRRSGGGCTGWFLALIILGATVVILVNYYHPFGFTFPFGPFH